MPSIDDKKLFRDVDQALKSMGVAADDIKALWKVVAAIIHLVKLQPLQLWLVSQAPECICDIDKADCLSGSRAVR